MKLKTRLMVAFCIIIILPIALAGAAILGLYRIQTKAIQKNYGLEASDTQGVLFEFPAADEPLYENGI